MAESQERQSVDTERTLKTRMLRVGPLALLVATGGGAIIYALTRPPAQEETSSTSLTKEDHLDEVRAGAEEILATIVAQEAKKDATCWSSVRMIEGFSLGRQLQPAAEIARIEVTRSLLERVWRRASEENEVPGKMLTRQAILAATPPDVQKATDALDIAAARTPGADVLGQTNQGMKDVHKTTENWRAILSLLLSEAISPVGLDRLAPEGSVALAKASTAMTSLVLREAASFAEGAKHDQVHLQDVQQAYGALVEQWFQTPLKKSESSTQDMPADAFRVARHVTVQNTENKLAALAEYNHLQKAPSFDQAGELAPYLEKLVGFPIGPDGAAALADELRSFAKLFIAESLPQRSDTFSDSTLGLNKGPGPQRLIDLGHVFNAVQDLFPTKRSPNADAEVLMTRNVVPPGGGKSIIQEKRVALVAPSLDAVRDTGIHWLTLGRVLEDEPNVALDPFAAELLTETLSEYAYFLLLGSVRTAVGMKQPTVTSAVVQANPWKFPKGRFFPVMDPEENTLDSAPMPPLEVKPIFVEKPVPESVSADAARKCTEGRGGFQAFMGSGVGVGDYDSDGDPDLFAAADGCNRLLRNEGGFRFTDVTDEQGIAQLTSTSRHPIFVDVDGDAELDLFVTQSGALSRLFLQRDGRFVDHTAQSGIKTTTAAHNAHFFDFDRDGDLDLFVGHYGKSKGEVATPTLDGRNGYPNQLYQNEGGGRFTDVSEKAHVASTGWNLASAALDLDGDGYLDFWLANDFGRDQVFWNQKDGTFREIGEELRTDDRGSGMNVSVVDINRDGLPDVFISMIEMFSKTLRFVLPREDTAFEVDDRVLASSYFISGMKLFTAEAKPSRNSALSFGFSDSSKQHIDTSRKGWAWGAAFFDYDLDGDQDMYLANGWIQKSAFYEQYNQFMVNHEGRLFTFGPLAAPAPNTPPLQVAQAPAPEASALSFSGSSRAVAAADLDGDGKQDMIVVDYQRGLRIFANQSPARGSSLRVILEGKGLNFHGIGAKVEVRVDDLPVMTRFVDAGAHYLAQSEAPVFFGLPPGKSVREVIVTWPDGKKTKVEKPPLSQGKLTVKEP